MPNKITKTTELVQRSRIKILAGIPFLLLSACATSYSTMTYKESFSSILISEDQKKIVILGEKFHYVFDVPERLPEFLSSPLRPSLSARFSHVSVEEDGHIEGYLNLFLPFDYRKATEEQKALAGKLGMTVVKSLVYSAEEMHLKGQRFLANQATVPTGTSTPLNRTYIAEIYESPTKAEVYARLNPSPVQRAADGALLLLAIPLLPFLFCPNCR